MPATSTINPHRHVNRRHATILGCWGYEFTHLHRALALMGRHRERFRWRDLVTREYTLAEAGQALADMERARRRQGGPAAVTWAQSGNGLSGRSLSQRIETIHQRRPSQ